jgi:arsenate reductase (glutaredoxin)
MLIFLHNRRCSKSREALEILEKSWKKYVMREYLKNPLDLEELLDLQEKLGSIPAIDFTRKKESEFIEQGLHKNSTDLEILKKMQSFPKLMERPIIYNDRKAVIWRPVEKILEIFKK